MCKMKSAIILKDRVFIPDYDSHSKMLEELKIADTRESAERLFIRAELSPRGGDVFSDIDTWEFIVDQDIHPDWYVEEVDKTRMVEAVKEWVKDRIHIGVDGLKIGSGRNHYIKDCKNVVIFGSSTVKAYGSSTVKAYGSSTVTAFDSSTVEACDSSTVKAYGSSTVKAYDSSTVKAYGSSTVKAYGSSTVEACDSSTVKAYGSSTVEAFDSSTVEACDSSTVTAYGSSTVKAYGSSTVTAYGSSTVKAYGSSTVIKNIYSSFDKANLILSDNATFKDNATKIIYQAGEWELRLIGKDGKING